MILGDGMMKLKPALIGLGLGLLAISTPALAQDGTGLACMAASYDTAKATEIATLAVDFEMNATGADASTGKLAQIAATSTLACLSENGWSQNQQMPAILYETGRLFEIGYRSSGSMTDAQIDMIDTALADGDRTELWEMLEKATIAGMKGEDPNLTEAEQLSLGVFVIGAGLGSDLAVATKVGELLGLMSLKSYGEKQFAEAGAE